MTVKKGHEIPTIDVALVSISADGVNEIILDTSSQIQVSVQSETQDAVKLIVKGRLIAQKPQVTTVTGNTIVLTDNVFNPEVVKILQGGTVKYWTTAEHTAEGETDAGFGVSSYAPPVAGSTDKGSVFKLIAYSAIYNAAGILTGYEKITYPNCQGVPVAFNSQDGAFRAPEYTINSAPNQGEAPYTINYIGVDELPTVSA